MTDRALSEEAMLISLRDIQMPTEAAGGIAADLAVAVGLASLIALLVSGLLRALSLKCAEPASLSPADRLDQTRHLPAAERRVEQLHLLRSLAPERYAELRGAIYEPGGGIAPSALEAELRRHV
ncbi:hypothetical protein So717_40130 [Roseobacter cerasinus]|uniref:Uncharacterized protein n=1 Tax=Roseobacter cerasinus TaxID=2602289 RepID=A0A640VY10_9RHOB|nr:hypothetical protein [Roseobacter cerasinus]GFE52260.1 hypothetical protein So717_40130 [Roseobacter cerasinus]